MNKNNEVTIRRAIEVVANYEKAMNNLTEMLDQSDEFLDIVNNSAAQRISEYIFPESIDEVNLNVIEWSSIVKEELEKLL